MIGFNALGRAALGKWGTGNVPGEGGSAGETGEDDDSESGEVAPITEPQVEAEILWPFDELKPRHLGLYPMAAVIGGGVSLTGKEATIDSTAGFWRVVLGGIPVKTRTNTLIWRGLEAECEGRSRTFAITIPDGKRAPWPATPGGTIDATSANIVLVGTDGVQIVPVDIGDVEVGMGFSVADRYYRIISVTGESSVFDCIFWPPARVSWPVGQALEFRRPLCRVRLASDDGMSMDLDGHKRADMTVEFVEAL